MKCKAVSIYVVLSLLPCSVIPGSVYGGDVRTAAVPGPTSLAPGLDSRASARCLKWNYYCNPVEVTASEDATGFDLPRYAFDGYPSSLKQCYQRTCWRADAPAPDKPTFVVIDYKRPIAVTRYLHCYDRFRTPCAWKDVDILSGNDNQDWTLLQKFTNLPPDDVQALGIDKPSPTRYYKLVIHSLADGAPGIRTHEIETYSGATIGNIGSAPSAAVQSEACNLSVRVTSSDVSVRNARLKLVAPKDSVGGTLESAVPAVAKGGGSVVSLPLTALHSGQIPTFVELYVGNKLVDRRPYTIRAQPKLVFENVTPKGAVLAKSGDRLEVSGTLRNAGTRPAAGVIVSWMGGSARLGDLAAGQSASFELNAKASPGYAEGQIVAKSSNSASTVVRRSVICRSTDRFSVVTKAVESEWTSAGEATKISVKPKSLAKPLTATISLLDGLTALPAGVDFLDQGPSKLGLREQKPLRLIPVGGKGSSQSLAAIVPGGVLLARIGSRADTGDLNLDCEVIPDDPSPIVAPYVDLEMRVVVDDPKIMYLPGIEWYTIGGLGAVYPRNSAFRSQTRMLCTQTSDATLSLVPDTDNIYWGFTGPKTQQMSISLQIPLGPYDPLGQGIWRPIYEAPSRFDIAIPVRKGDYWDAYLHVVKDIFKFEQARQWAMPISQAQMLAMHQLLGPTAWSEKYQTIIAYLGAPEFFFNFYGVTYSVPALYSWYLATDNETARIKAGKVIDWLMNVQLKDGPYPGAWWSQYASPEHFANLQMSHLYKGANLANSIGLIGCDQRGLRWLEPHATGSAVKTLLYYWDATGRTDDRVFDAAKRGADWLVANQRPDGGWPYGFDYDTGKKIGEGNPMPDSGGDSGQIWCAWALWKMYRFTGEENYKSAALRSKDWFKKAYVDIHRYYRYWEDAAGWGGNFGLSWDGYPGAVAIQVFADMGDKELAVQVARDMAAFMWTRVISTRQYETCYGRGTEASTNGPCECQSPYFGMAFQQVYALTGDPIWSDFAGAAKAVNAGADPDREYGMVNTMGWDDPTTGWIGPPIDDLQPVVPPGNAGGVRGVWSQWGTDHFAFSVLRWLIYEGNFRAPKYFNIDPDTLRGAVFGQSGRVKMPEEKCDIAGIDHIDINWVGYQNDDSYALLVMNHKEKVTVLIRPHEAHLYVCSRPPRILVGNGGSYKEAPVVKKGVQYQVEIPEKASAILIWDRMK